MKTRIIVLIFALVLLTVFTTAFAMINYANTVKVWPLMNFHPLTLVIGVSFFLGVGAGSLLVSLLYQQRAHTSSPIVPEQIPARSKSEHRNA